MLIVYEGIPYKSIKIANLPECLVRRKALMKVIWQKAMTNPEHRTEVINISKEWIYIWPKEEMTPDVTINYKPRK